MNPTSISWVLGPDGKPGFSWNPFMGCSAESVSPGCSRCYAKRLAATRLAHLPAYKGITKVVESLDERESDHRWTGEVRFFPEKLAEPMRRRTPAGIFVGDMGDIALLPYEQIAAIFGVMVMCQRHRFYVLTKRPEQLRECFAWMSEEAQRTRQRWEGKLDGPPIAEQHEVLRFATKHEAVRQFVAKPKIHQEIIALAPDVWPLPNVWIGTSVCTQEDAERKIPELLQIPAAVRFLSVEPLLENVRIDDIGNRKGGSLKPLVGLNWVPTSRGMELSPKAVGPRIDWVLIGGESGPHARSCNVEWIRSIVGHCLDAGVACWVKQAGANPVRIADVDGFGPKVVRLCTISDRAGADPAEWPADLRVRQMPEVLR